MAPKLDLHLLGLVTFDKLVVFITVFRFYVVTWLLLVY